MVNTLPQALYANFLGKSPGWYKKAIIAFLLINPVLAYISPYVAGWLLVLEFIFTLAMALKCYPLQPGGLLAIEAVIIGLVSPETVLHEVENNIGVILLLIFMVAGIYFMKSLLLFTFTRIILGVKSKVVLSVIFSLTAAVLSAFLDALTVTAVIISVAVGFYSVYHKIASGKKYWDDHNHTDDHGLKDHHAEDLQQFRAFLRSLLMHGIVGTALGGVATQVGEPQNLLIAEKLGWDFIEFFMRMAPVSIPILILGLLTCVLLEKTRKFDYGAQLPESVRGILEDFQAHEQKKLKLRDKANLIVQALVAVLLVISLALHVAEVGLIGLMIIILATAGTGITEEHQIGKAFEEALPFTALLVVFFAVVGVIHTQHLFTGVINAVLAMEPEIQAGMFFIANGILSMISDNVFVATVYIDEVLNAFQAGAISREQFEILAVAINTGTNLPSVATPNGQAAFLFLLTSAVSPLIRLSYGKMVWMALPYTLVLGVSGYLLVHFVVAA
ncbi:MAG: sodium/proton antiporter NhaB [Gammaproteobacteria bacterium]|nr:MAG: sodium/proton antiporter NhaB [Gammaproteobacteria bacterium]